MSVFNNKANLSILLLQGLFTIISVNKAAAQSISPLNQADTLIRNPIIKYKYTADPAALVYKDKVYLYTGHDEALPGKNNYVMHDWLCFSSSDLVSWTEHPSPLNVKEFQWAKDDAWASQVIERNGKFYWYAAVEHNSVPGKAIGVAVADNPLGPFKDARGSALITNSQTGDAKMFWDDIDPSVIIDDDGQAYLFWGNSNCYYAKLKEDMIQLDGPVLKVEGLVNYTEAPWIHKRNGIYYLSYASQFPERISYAMSKSIHGPWTFKGILNEVAGNSNTNHQAIIDFKGKSYFIYHNGVLPNGGSFRRSVCIDYLYYNRNGSIKRIQMSSSGVDSAK